MLQIFELTLQWCILFLFFLCVHNFCDMDFDDLPVLSQVVSLLSNDEDLDLNAERSGHDQTCSHINFCPGEE